MRLERTSAPRGVRGVSPFDRTVATQGRCGIRVAQCRPLSRSDLELDAHALESAGPKLFDEKLNRKVGFQTIAMRIKHFHSF